MNLDIMIPDDAVRQMLATGRRVQGTISLANAREGNFHPHRRNAHPEDDVERTEVMLRCGKAIVTKKRLSLHLNVKRECVEFPAYTIRDDCKEASEFFEEYEEYDESF
jgi:hypothetical protein